MKGNLLFNLVFGAVGFVLTLLISMGNNLFMTSLIRGLISFVIWFLLAFCSAGYGVWSAFPKRSRRQQPSRSGVPGSM